MAKIYGEVLRDLGLLSKGDVVLKTPADFKVRLVRQHAVAWACVAQKRKKKQKKK